LEVVGGVGDGKKFLKVMGGSWIALLCCPGEFQVEREDCSSGGTDRYLGQLSKILASARNRESSDPKDKAYGIYGICRFLDINMPPPIYEKSVEQIFFDMTRTIIEGESDLRKINRSNFYFYKIIIEYYSFARRN
jgi:hypothetical protein